MVTVFIQCYFALRLLQYITVVKDYAHAPVSGLGSCKAN